MPHDAATKPEAPAPTRYREDRKAKENEMTAKCVLVRAAQPMGEYKPTGLDAAKESAEFRLVDATGRLNRIIWSDGRGESVTDRELKKLQAAHTWATDF